MYNMAAHSFQTILEAEIEGDEMKNFLRIKKEHPTKPIVVFTRSPMILEELVNSRFLFWTNSFC